MCIDGDVYGDVHRWFGNAHCIVEARKRDRDFIPVLVAVAPLSIRPSGMSTESLMSSWYLESRKER